MTAVLIGLKIYAECCGLIYPFNRGCEHLFLSVCKETGSHFFCEIQVSRMIEKESSSQVALMHWSNCLLCMCRAIDAGCILEMPKEAWIANKKKTPQGAPFWIQFLVSLVTNPAVLLYGWNCDQRFKDFFRFSRISSRNFFIDRAIES